MAEIFRMTLYCRVQKITAVKLGTYKSPVRTGTNFPIENLVCVWLSLLKPSGISGSGLLFAWCLSHRVTLSLSHPPPFFDLSVTNPSGLDTSRHVCAAAT